MDNRPEYMDYISTMAAPQRIYLDLDNARPSTHVRVLAMGIHELMPRGMILHGGPGSGYPFLLMLFHSPADVIGDDGLHSPACGKLIIWNETTVHRYGNPDRQWDHTWLQVGGEWARRNIGSDEIPLDRLFDLPEGHFVERYLQLLHDELQRERPQNPDVVEGILRLLCHELSRVLAPASLSKPHDARLEVARRYIEMHCTEPFDLARAADEACLSRSHFCWRFSRQYGAAPREYAMRLRLYRAAHLLSSRDLAVFQVAEMVGYDDALYFSRLFTRRYGVNPRRYRQHMHQGTKTIRN